MKLLLAESDDFSKEVLSDLNQNFDLKIINNLSQNEFEKALSVISLSSPIISYISDPL